MSILAFHSILALLEPRAEVVVTVGGDLDVLSIFSIIFVEIGRAILRISSNRRPAPETVALAPDSHIDKVPTT
jgi:hypothetical protein